MCAYRQMEVIHTFEDIFEKNITVVMHNINPLLLYQLRSMSAGIVKNDFEIANIYRTHISLITIKLLL